MLSQSHLITDRIDIDVDCGVGMNFPTDLNPLVGELTSFSYIDQNIAGDMLNLYDQLQHSVHIHIIQYLPP